MVKNSETTRLNFDLEILYVKFLKNDFPNNLKQKKRVLV